VISHPECNFEVCKLSDYVGSTDYIIKTIAASAPGTRWLVGTELNLVNRIAEEFKPQGKVVQFMAPTVCMCSTMARIDPPHLAWTLENLVAGKVVIKSRCRTARSGSRTYFAGSHAGGVLSFLGFWSGVPRKRTPFF
jgi:quinolinate synthase